MGRYEETRPAVGRDARVGGGVGIGHEECFEGIAFMGSRSHRDASCDLKKLSCMKGKRRSFP